MKLKLVIFVLDGVLVDTKDIHYKTLNNSIKDIAGEQYCIDAEEHLNVYDGLKTFQKLDILTKNKNLNPSLHKEIWIKKQEATIQYIDKYMEFEFPTLDHTSDNITFHNAMQRNLKYSYDKK